MDKIIETLEEFKYIEIEKDSLPYSFTYDYEGHIFEFEIKYNEEYDSFTIDLYILDNAEKKVIILGEKIMLNQMLFMNISYLNIDLPKLIPYDFSGNSKRCGYDEIDSIYLVVMDYDPLG